MELNILICGIGGQGVVFLGSFLKNYYLSKYPDSIVLGTESRGVSQREGSVIASVRIQTEPNPQIIFSPEIPPMSADIVIALEPLELLRNFDKVQKNTLILFNNDAIMPKNSVQWMTRNTTNERALHVKTHSNPNWRTKRVEELVDAIPIEPNRKRFVIKQIVEPGDSREFTYPKLSFSKHDTIMDVNFTNIILEVLEDSSNLNVVMLGFLAAITKDFLEIEELRKFIPQFFKDNPKLIAKNLSALNFGEKMAYRYSMMRYFN